MLFFALLPALLATLMFIGTVRLKPRRTAAKLVLRVPAETLGRHPSVTPLPRRAVPSTRRAA